ncbi:divalent metal cation transporter [bacterium]|nr:divalent metal cation transporter [bacterium]
MTHINFFEFFEWKESSRQKSLDEVHKSVPVPKHFSWLRKLFAFAGPGYMVAVGYMDPGNWATDLGAGSAFGYSLLFVVLGSSVMAMILQYLSLKLGVATGRDLAQACRDFYSRRTSVVLWIFAEVAIIACDLAEIIGSAIGLNLLFHIPLTLGVLLTGLDVMLLVMLQKKGFRYLEALVLVLVVTIVGCFGYQIAVSHPSIADIAGGFFPTTRLLGDPKMMVLAVGILGATVMPHNLYLHSAIVQTRDYDESQDGKREAIWFSALDSTVALFLAFLVNASILIVAATVFHRNGLNTVTEITEAHRLLAPILGSSVAGVVFALALLASGQNSTITGTLAGQIIMEGFLKLRLKPWVRRLLTRLLAIVPALVVIMIWGDHGLGTLLIISQVILSVQLPFAVFPLVQFTSNEITMGEFKNSTVLRIVAYGIGGLITCANLWMVWSVVR